MGTTSRQVPIKRRALNSILLVLPALAVLALYLGLRSSGNVPSTVATHWSGTMYPDGFTSFGPFLATCLALTLVGGMLGLLGMGAARPGTQVALLFFGGLAAWTAAALFAGCVVPTVVAGDPAHAVLGGWLLLLIAGCLVGLVPAWSSGVYQQASRIMRHEREEKIARGQGRELPAPLPVPQHTLQRSVNAPAWLWLLSGALVLFTGFMLFELTGEPEDGGLAGLIFGPVLLVLVLGLVLGLCRITVRVDERGLLVASGILGFTMRRIGLEKIESVQCEHIAPGEWGGWGWRFFPGGSAIVFRAMDGLVVHTTDGKRFAVTMNGAETVRDQLLARQAGGGTRA